LEHERARGKGIRIALIVEGATEVAFLPFLRKFLASRELPEMPRLKSFPQRGRIPTRDKLKRLVSTLLQEPDNYDHVVALTDVYTGTKEFTDANDARVQMREWVGPQESRFHPHAAQYDFEAWLLPYWPTIQKLAKHNRGAPSGRPESVNHDNPPSMRIREIFELGSCRESYSKPRDAPRILNGQDLLVAAAACPELRALLNTLLTCAGGEAIPHP
jgi:hypothetical protein